MDGPKPEQVTLQLLQMMAAKDHEIATLRATIDSLLEQKLKKPEQEESDA